MHYFAKGLLGEMSCIPDYAGDYSTYNGAGASKLGYIQFHYWPEWPSCF